MKLVRMSTRGRVTIPRELREELGLKPGDRVAFTETENGILLEPVRGTLLDHRGSLEVDGEQDFERIGREVFKEKGNKQGR
mgnify:CR=1 FL=1